MNKLLLATAITATTALSGCATILQGTTDNVSLQALGATDKYTQCVIKSGDMTYTTMGKIDTVALDRSSADLVIECENETQEGSAVIESSFNGAWLLADLLWDLCIFTLSCPIDAATGAFFDYPNKISVDMVNKDGSVNQRLVIDKRELEEAIALKKAQKEAMRSNNGPRS